MDYFNILYCENNSDVNQRVVYAATNTHTHTETARKIVKPRKILFYFIAQNILF